MLAYTVRYSVTVAGAVQRGELVIMADKMTEARIKARERILFLCGAEPTWLSISNVA